ncbi:hypothetical protein [Brevundimonas sp. Root1279]|uniref:hypothetical protein n=1 Tax=Brevundimonas sp. Root1279 TaxID=1736443 RepID=UPI000700865D|nr:hypothetical protein [Brevundimonas sp. Root1279]KQW86532.1 hypothetical protein ASC65_01160 [Brevundimonas sp. Root1279]
MPFLRHEGRRFLERDGLAFWLSSPEAIAQLERIDGPSEQLYVVYAETIEAAMQAHYDHQGWGRYKPIPGVTDIPYDADRLVQQLDEYPDDAELRRLNGL